MEMENLKRIKAKKRMNNDNNIENENNIFCCNKL